MSTTPPPHIGTNIRVGIGGWTYTPWRGVFYPPGLRQADELAWASRRLRCLEINATSQSVFSADTFARWAAQTPDGFVFAVKAHRACVNRRVLADTGEAIARFLGQGLEAMENRLGPMLWSFMPTKAFGAEDFAAFLNLLPDQLAGRPLRHCVEPRHASFADPAFAALCKSRGVAICLTDSPKFPMIDENTGGFRYVRLMQGVDEIETGYPPDELETWAERLRTMAKDQRPEGSGEVFAFFINAGKLRAPMAALALGELTAARSGAADGQRPKAG